MPRLQQSKIIQSYLTWLDKECRSSTPKPVSFVIVECFLMDTWNQVNSRHMCSCDVTRQTKHEKKIRPFRSSAIFIASWLPSRHWEFIQRSCRAVGRASRLADRHSWFQVFVLVRHFQHLLRHRPLERSPICMDLYGIALSREAYGHIILKQHDMYIYIYIQYMERERERKREIHNGNAWRVERLATAGVTYTTVVEFSCCGPKPECAPTRVDIALSSL